MSEPASAVAGPGDGWRLWRRITRRSVVIGVATAVIVVAAGVLLVVFRPHSWTATASLVVLPDSAIADPSTAASYYDTLSAGQVPTTFAQILQSRGSSAQLASDTGLSRVQLKDVTVTVNPVPDTSIIDVSASAPTANRATLVANRVAKAGARTLRTLRTPYATSTVDQATPEIAKPVGPSALMLVAVVAVVAVVAGVGAQQGSWLAGVAMRRRGTQRPVPAETANHVPHQPVNQAWPAVWLQAGDGQAGDGRAGDGRAGAARPPQPGAGPAAGQVE